MKMQRNKSAIDDKEAEKRAQWNENEKLKMRKGEKCEKCGLGNEKTKGTRE